MILWLGIKRIERIESVKEKGRKEILEEEEFYGGGKGTREIQGGKGRRG